MTATQLHIIRAGANAQYGNPSLCGEIVGFLPSSPLSNFMATRQMLAGYTSCLFYEFVILLALSFSIILDLW
jgi:hypothetical protein